MPSKSQRREAALSRARQLGEQIVATDKYLGAVDVPLQRREEAIKESEAEVLRIEEANKGTMLERFGGTLMTGTVSIRAAMDIAGGAYDDNPPEPGFEDWYWKNRAELERGKAPHQIERMRTEARSQEDLRRLNVQFSEAASQDRLLQDQNLFEGLVFGAAAFITDLPAMAVTGGIGALPRYGAKMATRFGAAARSAERGAVEGLAFAGLQSLATTQHVGLEHVLAYSGYGAGFGAAFHGSYLKRPDTAAGKPAPTPVPTPTATQAAPAMPPAPAPAKAPEVSEPLAAKAASKALPDSIDAQVSSLEKAKRSTRRADVRSDLQTKIDQLRKGQKVGAEAPAPKAAPTGTKVVQRGGQTLKEDTIIVPDGDGGKVAVTRNGKVVEQRQEPVEEVFAGPVPEMVGPTPEAALFPPRRAELETPVPEFTVAKEVGTVLAGRGKKVGQGRGDDWLDSLTREQVRRLPKKDRARWEARQEQRALAAQAPELPEGVLPKALILPVAAAEYVPEVPSWQLELEGDEFTPDYFAASSMAMARDVREDMDTAVRALVDDPTDPVQVKAARKEVLAAQVEDALALVKQDPAPVSELDVPPLSAVAEEDHTVAAEASLTTVADGSIEYQPVGFAERIERMTKPGLLDAGGMGMIPVGKVRRGRNGRSLEWIDGTRYPITSTGTKNAMQHSVEIAGQTIGPERTLSDLNWKASRALAKGLAEAVTKAADAAPTPVAKVDQVPSPEVLAKQPHPVPESAVEMQAQLEAVIDGMRAKDVVAYLRNGLAALGNAGSYTDILLGAIAKNLPDNVVFLLERRGDTEASLRARAAQHLGADWVSGLSTVRATSRGAVGTTKLRVDAPGAVIVLRDSDLSTGQFDKGVSTKTIAHELLHAVLSHRLAGAVDALGIAAARNELRDILATVQRAVAADRNSRVGAAGAALRPVWNLMDTIGTDIDEFVAYVMTDSRLQRYLADVAMPVKQPESAWSATVRTFRKVLGLPTSEGIDSALGRLVTVTSDLLDYNGPIHPANSLHARGVEITRNMAAVPQQAVTMEDYARDFETMEMHKAIRNSAKQWLKENPIDPEKVFTLYNKVPALRSLGQGMIQHPDEAVRALAVKFLELTTGAAGRNNQSPAITAANRYNRYTSVELAEIEVLYKQFRKGNTKRFWLVDEVLHGEVRKKWHDTISREIEHRRKTRGMSHPDSDPLVQKAAALYGKMAKLMAEDQIKHGTLGSININPNESEWYMPRIISGKAYAAAPDAARLAVAEELARQMAKLWGGDKDAMAMAKEAAQRYLQHGANKAHGFRPLNPLAPHALVDSMLATFEGSPYYQSNPKLRDMLGKMRTGAAKHTMTRIDLDLDRYVELPDGSSYYLMDMFDRDVSRVFRQYARRVAGEVGLAKGGMLGKQHAQAWRDAIAYAPDDQRSGNSVDEGLDMFDQMMAEFLGEPFGYENRSLNNIVQLTASNRLGGAFWAQFGDLSNMVNHFGADLVGREYMTKIASTLKGVMENRTEDPVLDAFIEYAGVHGFDYKVAFPFAEFDNVAELGADDLGAFTRAVQATGHYSKMLTGYTHLHMGMSRGVSVLTVHASVQAAKRFAQDGTIHPLLRDMGMDEKFLRNLNHIMDDVATFDAEGRLVKLDLRGVSPEFAEAWSVIVSRGTKQVVQGTFVGENAPYQHNVIGRLLTQFRVTPLLAMEKQFKRQSTTAGMWAYTGYVLGAFMIAAPLHFLRVSAAGVAMSEERQEEYYDKQLSPLAFARASMNYMINTGMAADIFDLSMSLTAGVASAAGVTYDGEDAGDVINEALNKGRGGTLTDRFIPSLGYINSAAGATAGLVRRDEDGDWDPMLYEFLRSLPSGRNWLLAPPMNTVLMDDEE